MSEDNIMQYTRVIPRDFFNEAKLLKCLGQLSLKILQCEFPENIKVTIEENGEPFEIVLMEEGSLYVRNYVTTINDKHVLFKTTYNSKENYPLLCEYNNEEVTVFDNSGCLSNEFKEFLKGLKAGLNAKNIL